LKRWLQIAGLGIVAIIAVIVALQLTGRSSHKIAERAKQQSVVAEPDALSAKLIPSEDLPPEGTRSLFDHLVAQNESLPFPFEKLMATIGKLDPSNQPPLVIMIPQGRSLLKASADYEHPRVLLAADFQAPDKGALGLSPRGELFLGFVENAHEIEVISYNEAAGRFEFQLVQDYCEGCQPKLVYAKRAVCTTCHQGAAPIFPQRPWNETNGQPQTAAKIVEARSAAGFNRERYLTAPIDNPLSAPERFDELTDIGAFIPVTQRIWIDGCGDGDAGVNCRKQLLKLALAYLWNPGDFDDKSREAQKLRDLQVDSWPPKGIAVPGNDLFNRDPLAERKSFRGWINASVTSLLPHRAREAEPKSNEDLEAFERLPKLRTELDPLTPRAPKRVLTAQDVDGAFGLAALFTPSDFKQLETASKVNRENLVGAVDQVEPAFFKLAPFARVKAMQALLVALGNKTAPEYCCLSTADLSPPVASGEPPVAIAKGSPLEPFSHYCFACHRGNPAKRLNFMAGKTEEEVLAHLKDKSEIRDVLDWSRYRGTDKETKLMPPADSAQRRQLERALADNPKQLEEMRSTVPSLFNF
jgi:mono/diheme cytochrome c family protein